MGIRLMFWAGAGECRLAEQSPEGWALSAPLSLEALYEALGELAAGREPSFAREGAVAGLVGAEDITHLAALYEGERRRESSSRVRLLCWMDHSPQEYRLTEPCESGEWKISAPLADAALWRAMRSLARGRTPKFRAAGTVTDIIGADDITDGAAQAVADNG